MPQPISRMVPDAEVFISSDAIAENPDMAILACKIFSVWAQVERELSFLMVRILGAEATPALAIYDALNTQGLRTTALKAAAQAVLAGEELRVLLAALTVTTQAAKERNKLAHWPWGGCKQRPDLLVLFDPAMLYRRDFNVSQFYGRDLNSTAGFHEGLALHFFDNERVLAYTKSDLERSLAVVSDAYEVIELVNVIFDPGFTNSVAEFMTGKISTNMKDHLLNLLLKMSPAFKEAFERQRSAAPSAVTQPGGEE